MKTNLILNSLLVITVLAFLGCDKNSSRKIEDKKNPNVEINSQMDAKALTEAAEQLMAPHTFMISYKAAKMALEKDPSNTKAEFYVKFLKRFEAFRGVYSRIKPKTTEEQNKLTEANRKLPKSPLKEFLNEKGSDIKDIPDVQDVLSEYFMAVNEFRIFLKEKETSELEINLNPLFFQEGLTTDASKNCGISQENTEILNDENSNEEAKLNCNLEQALTRKLNIADLIMLRQMTSGELLYSIINNYSLSGLEKLSGLNQDGNMTSKEMIEILNAQPEFGKLRNGNFFSTIKQIGVDLVAAVKWANQYQNSICPKGYEIEDQRKGYLFKNGLCLNPEKQTYTDRLLSLMEKALVGPIEIELPLKNGNLENKTVDFFKWTENPISDLRKIRPMRWDKCNQVISFYDNSLGGLFPNNDFHDLVKKECD